MLSAKTILPLLLVGSLATLCAAQTGERVTLQMRFRLGESNRYHTTAQTAVTYPVAGKAEPDQTVLDIDLVQQMVVQQVLLNGSGEIAVTTQSGSIRMNGKPYGDPTKDAVVTTYNPNGSISAIKGKANTAGGLLGSGALGMQSVYLPKKPVRVGESWSQEIRLPGLPVNGAGRVTNTLLAMENIGHFRTARLRARLVQPLKILLTADGQPTEELSRCVYVLSGEMSMTFVSNFAPDEGKIIRSSGSGGAVLTQRTKGAAPPKKKDKAAPVGRITLRMTVGCNLIE